MHRPGPAMLLLGLAACGGETATFQLALVPSVAGNQSPFEGATGIELVLEHDNGDSERLSLSAVEGSPSIDIDGALDGTRIRVEVETAGSVGAVGQTGPLLVSEGERSAGVLVLETDAMAFLDELDTHSFGAGAVSAGDGRFLLFGGLDIRDYTKDGTDSGAILALDLGALEAGATPAFVEVGTMPSFGIGYVDGAFEAEETTGRHGHSSSLVQSDGGPRVLVAGGSHSYIRSENITQTAFLYDPETGDIEVLSSQQDLKKPRYLHRAVTNSQGDVVVMGGFGRVEPNFLTAELTFEIYSADDQDFARPVDLQAAALYGMAVALGTQGVVYCGGGALAGGTTWIPDARCVQISLAGELSTVFDDLPVPLSHASLVALDEQRLLLTGGVTSEVSVEQTAALSALDRAFVYTPEIGWTEIQGMSQARARHASVLLPSGEVLILGGVTNSGLQFLNDINGDTLACAEIFDPVTETFAPVDSCSADHNSATLPTRMSDIDIAQDPDFGILLAGGLDGDSSLQSTALWAPAP